MKKNNGFSLIEIMVSLAIMSVLVVGIIGLVSGATKAANKQANQSVQNAQIRVGLQTAQNSLSNADRPLMYVPATAGAANGNEIVYSRTEDQGPSKPVVYVAERLKVINSAGDSEGDIATASASSPPEASLVLQRIILGQATAADRQTRIAALSSNPSAPSSPWKSATSKVLIDKIQLTEPFFSFKASAGKPADVAGGLVDNVGLVDIAISRDGDGSGKQYAVANLKTSIYLSKVAGRSTLANPIGCDPVA